MNQFIIRSLSLYYGLEIIALTHLPFGADMDAKVYKSETREGKCYFVKLKKGGHREIPVIIADFFEKEGVQGILQPIQTMQGKSMQQIDHMTLTVYPFLEGANGFCQRLTGRQWVEFGQILRQIHNIEVPLEIQNRIGREDFSSKWREKVRALYLKAPTNEPIPLKFFEFLQKNKQLINRLIERAEYWSAVGSKLAAKYVLCHSDLHGGNVLLTTQGTLYLVDWDDPIMAPKEKDLMFIGGGVGNVWNVSGEEALFYEGYGPVNKSKELLAYYRYERIVKDIAAYAEQLLSEADSNKNKEETYQSFLSIFNPGGVVDIAFATDM